MIVFGCLFYERFPAGEIIVQSQDEESSGMTSLCSSAIRLMFVGHVHFCNYIFNHMQRETMDYGAVGLQVHINDFDLFSIASSSFSCSAGVCRGKALIVNIC